MLRRGSTRCSRRRRARSHSTTSSDITADHTMLRRRPWKVIRGWSPVPASNATTPSLYPSEQMHLGRDEIRRFRLRQTQIIDVGAASLECTVNGSGDPLVVLANAGCSTGYLESFGERITGSQIIAINMRGVGASRGPLGNATLHDLASDVPDFWRRSSAAPFTSWVTHSVTGS